MSRKRLSLIIGAVLCIVAISVFAVTAPTVHWEKLVVRVGTLYVNGSQVTAATAASITAGASGTAGTYTVYPATGSRGKTTLTASDNSGDTITNINTALQAGARTYTVPDAGGNASFVMTAGAQTVGGVKTFSSAPVLSAGLTVPHAGGAADLAGSATLTAGTVTVATTAVTANSLVFLTINTPTSNTVTVSAPAASIVAGTSFVINGNVAAGTVNAADNTTVVHWFIVN